MTPIVSILETETSVQSLQPTRLKYNQLPEYPLADDEVDPLEIAETLEYTVQDESAREEEFIYSVRVYGEQVPFEGINELLQSIPKRFQLDVSRGYLYHEFLKEAGPNTLRKILTKLLGQATKIVVVTRSSRYDQTEQRSYAVASAK